MSTPYQLVKQFHQTFKHLVRDRPTPLPLSERSTRIEFIHEELMEFLSADDIVSQADALADILYFVYGTFVNIGVDPERIFTAVHEANMRKLWDDGLPRWREGDGKVLKPPGWTGPEDAIDIEITRQHHAANIALLQEVSRQTNEKMQSGIVGGSLFGFPVVVDDTLQSGEVRLGDWSLWVGDEDGDHES